MILTNQNCVRVGIKVRMNFIFLFALKSLNSKTEGGGFLILNFCCVLNVVCFIQGNSPASEFVYADFSEHSVCSIFIGS